MLDLGPGLAGWLDTVGNDGAAATIVATSGSVPRPVGTTMLVGACGTVLGSLAGGCIEGAVVAAALEAIAERKPRRERYGYSSEDAFAVGLTCGGEVEVRIEPFAASKPGVHGLRNLLARLAHVGAGDEAALVQRIDAGGTGALLVADPARFRAADHLEALLGITGSPAAARSAAAQLSVMLPAGRTGVLSLPTDTGRCAGTTPALLVQTRLAAPRLLIFGANDFAEALLPAAQLLGYRVTLCDAREAFVRQQRFAAAHQIAVAWPHRYLAAEAGAGRIDARTVVCVLTHDPKFDIPLLTTALGLDLAYLGAMGSQRSHRQRVRDLRTGGITGSQLERLHSPIGLDLQAVTPAEVAVSITAHIIANRSRSATGRPLSACGGPIHADTPVATRAPAGTPVSTQALEDVTGAARALEDASADAQAPADIPIPRGHRPRSLSTSSQGGQAWT